MPSPRRATPDNVERTSFIPELGIQTFRFYHGNKPGLQVVLKNKNTDFQGSGAYFNMLMDCGSRQEKPHQLGGAHLLEHACFLGLGSSPEGPRDEYFWSVQGVRDNNNAWTEVNGINYSATTEASNYNNLLHTFAKMLSGANLEKLEDNRYYHQEQQNVVSEDHRGRSASSSARRTLVAATCMVNTALGLNNANPTIGVQDVYTSMSPEDLRVLHKQMFCPSRATLVVCGVRDDSGDFLNMVNNTLGQVPINVNVGDLHAPKPHTLSEMHSGQRMQMIQSGNAATYLALATAYPSTVKSQMGNEEAAQNLAQRVTLDLVHELLLPSNAPHNGVLKPLFDNGLVYDASIMPASSGYSSPTVMLLAIPSDLASEAQRVASVQGAVQYVMQSEMTNFSNFKDASALLDAAKQRLLDQDLAVANGGLAGMSEALLQGVRYDSPAYFFHRAEHAKHVTPQMIDAVMSVWSPNRTSMVVHSQHPVNDRTRSKAEVAQHFAPSSPLVSGLLATSNAPSTAPRHYDYVPDAAIQSYLISPISLNANTVTMHNNVACLQHPLQPFHMTEAWISYPFLAQRSSNFEEMGITAEAINRFVNNAVQNKMPAGANVRLCATPSATAMTVKMSVHNKYAAQAVQALHETLADGGSVVSANEVSTLIASHMALNRGSANTDASFAAERNITLSMFDGQDMVGFTKPSYKDRLSQLEKMHGKVNFVFSHFKEMANAGTASHAQVINNVVSNSASTSAVQSLGEHFKPSQANVEHVNHAVPTLQVSPSVLYTATSMANTPELVVHMAVPLEKVKLLDVRRDMKLRVCCEILNNCIGNSFCGRLMYNMRAREGLTYGTTCDLKFGEMLNDNANAYIHCTATLKPENFVQGMKLMQSTLVNALAADSQTRLLQRNNAEVQHEFESSAECLRVQYERMSTDKNVAAGLLQSHNMHGTRFNDRASYLGVALPNQGALQQLTHSEFVSVLQDKLPNASNLHVLTTAVGDKAEQLMDNYRNTATRTNATPRATPVHASFMLRLRL